jgi:hypothetical protein
MQHNLLLKEFDYYTSLFIDGLLPYELFEKIENEYLTRKTLFTICLN